MTQKKPIIAIILYKPSHTTYLRIITAIREGYKLYIFDNSPNCKSKLFIEEHKHNIRYFTFDKNIGIGAALKLMCATAYYEGNSELLYFDQDTIYNKETLEYIFDYINESSDIKYFEQRGKILSVTFRDMETKRKEKQIQEKISIGGFKLNIVDFTISNGTLFYLENLKKVGWHDEAFYIDGVDYAICLSAEVADLKIAEIFSTPGLDHNAEQGNRNYKFLFIKYNGRKYPMYRIKNYLYSSLKLIFKSSLVGSNKTIRILKYLAIYVNSIINLYIERGQ